MKLVKLHVDGNLIYVNTDKILYMLRVGIPDFIYQTALIPGYQTNGEPHYIFVDESIEEVIDGILYEGGKRINGS